MREIVLTQGQVTIVDDADYDWLMDAGPWHAKASGSGIVYAQHATRVQGRTQTVHMHQLITGYALTDHRDGNGLHNWRENLRASTSSQNSQNRRKSASSSNPYKGTEQIPSGRWRARIRVNRVMVNLGYYDTAELAAVAYNQAATEHFGEFARLNDVDPVE